MKNSTQNNYKFLNLHEKYQFTFKMESSCAISFEKIV